MSTSSPTSQSPAEGVLRAAKVIIVGSVMFSFISYWRTAAVVLCDLASTAYYIGGIVEQSVGPAAPWFILAVMLFSYAVRSVYIESCSLFIRGGVYRVVREALGRWCAKLAVSALIFDYLLTGPISGVSAGHYLMGLILHSLRFISEDLQIADRETYALVKSWGAVLIAIAVTLYFFRLNLRGIHESSDRALKIMIATTVMVVVILIWCGVTIGARLSQPELGPINDIPLTPNFTTPEPAKPGEHVVDPLGFLGHTETAKELRDPAQVDWLSLIGVIGVLIAFGHSILAMSGEETLAQVYREVESPKLPNFRRAAFIVFLYSLIFTAGISFLAVMLIPQADRTSPDKYSENLISGLAMNMVGPEWLCLLLNAFVVVVGFLILSGAVNTAIIGSNGVLNRVAEDGVMPDWFLKPHKHYGTTYRILFMIVGLQIAIIILSRGDVLILGEAYAFGVVWSFVFQALAMVVLRFKDPRPREYKVPFNFKVGSIEIPFGLLFVLLVLLSAALLNLLTKELATIFGLIFTAVFFTIFSVSEYAHEKKRRGEKHKHLEQFNEQAMSQVNVESLGLTKPFRRLVAIRSTQNLVMLEKALADTDPDSTDVVVMTAKMMPPGTVPDEEQQLDPYDQELMTAVVQRAERIGKKVKPLIVPTNNPLFALLRTAQDLKTQELVVGASNKYSADEQLEQIAFYWINLHGGTPTPLTVRVIGKDRDVHLDLAGGYRIPKLSERRARSVDELRAAGVGVDRVLLVPAAGLGGVDVFQAVLTMLDATVVLGVAILPGDDDKLTEQARAISEQLGREVQVKSLSREPGPDVVRLARDGEFDAIIVELPGDVPDARSLPLEPWIQHVVTRAHARVFLVTKPRPPQEAVD
jgi:amino acid transporter/nucleotide-binding universal stress UspA family protein